MASSISDSITDVPVIDVHNHLNPRSLSPRGFGDIIFYHYIVTELRSAGLSISAEDVKDAGELRKIMPYMRRIRNTATYWGLIRILRDLYGLDIWEINEGNVDDVVKVIDAVKGNEDRAIRVIRDYSKVRKSILTLNPLEPPPSYDKSLFTGALRLDPLIPDVNAQSLRRLGELTKVELRNIKDVDEALRRVFEGFRGHAVAVTLNLQPDDLFFALKPSQSHASPYFETLMSRGVVNPEGRDVLAAYILRRVLEISREMDLVVQVMLGAKRPVPGASPPDYAITFFNPTQLLQLTLIFAEYIDVKFDIIITDPLLNHASVVIAKNYPNVYLNGYWWYSMYPEVISSYLKLRLQALPYTKIGGFFSDAYVADWVYGKVTLIKHVLSSTLEEMVRQGYIRQDLAVEIANALFYRNPSELYGVK